MCFGGTVSSLAILRNRLLEGSKVDRNLVTPTDLGEAINTLLARAGSMGSGLVSSDAALKAVKGFWESKQISTFKETRLISFGLSLPVGNAGESILDEPVLFKAALLRVDELRPKPQLFRRCYHGLVKSYFDYDYGRSIQGLSGKRNWSRLRDYLSEHVGTLSTGQHHCPEWVLSVREFAEVFSEEPFGKLGRIALNGERHRISEFRSQLLIGDSSWFSRELFFAKLRAACELSDPEFVERLPDMLDDVAANSLLHDTGLGILLDRYASGKELPIHRKLRDHTVLRWGNPWLAANTMRWGNVRTNTRKLLSEWLKLEFIESFFTLLAEDGHSDKRRMEFWKRYVNEIEHVHFALGADARASRAKDFVELRQKAKELTVTLGDGPAQNNAFIMKMNGFIVVEFSGRSNALYVYSSSDNIPFDVNRTVYSATTSRNSLKSPNHFERLSHQDGIHGFAFWEDRFTKTLNERCKLKPNPSAQAYGGAMSNSLGRASNVSKGRSQVTKTTEDTSFWLTRSFSKALFDRFCSENKLKVEDFRGRGGNLWVHDPSRLYDVRRVLKHWGFRYKEDREAWWRQ
jgi:hypothetical protein